MRKSKRKSKEQRNQIIMAVFLSVIMVASMLGIMLNQESTTITYNDFKFRPVQNKGYVTKVNGEQVVFNYLPEDVQEFNVPGNFCSVLQDSAAIKILFEPNNPSVQFIDYIRLDFEEKLDKTIVSSITENSSAYSLFKVSNCSQSSALQPIIFFKESNTTGLELDNEYCLIAESSEQGYVLLKDRLLYCYYGIME
jgi:hypothetical protein